ncbi:hypothetical protein DF141_05095 [Burkholderia cenocepacia]|nr:hypothetical protein CFB44_18470 [Burkholderia sp. AU31280]RQU80170.1 hypothetical protein DF141_05095 [Burkholderia cenocepacia]RQV14563.1 hypothetical protein DF132_30385 [Burkholderia cenocepacia]RQV26134.1 hypothetical protein DF039_05405 [Burkholderia cenocepacia]RQV59946.1 hypothetical protein DF024_22020 [Burkholderia cenocepacia]
MTHAQTPGRTSRRHATQRNGQREAANASRIAHTLLQRTHTSHAKFPAQQYADAVRLRTVHRAIP